MPVSAYYADFMTTYLRAARGPCHAVPLGITLRRARAAPARARRGRSRSATSRGSRRRRACTCWPRPTCSCAARHGLTDVRLLAAGYLAPEHRGYLAADRGGPARGRARGRVPLPRDARPATRDRVPARARRALGAEPVRGAEGPLPAGGARQRRAGRCSRGTARSRDLIEATGGGLLFAPGRRRTTWRASCSVLARDPTQAERWLGRRRTACASVSRRAHGRATLALYESLARPAARPAVEASGRPCDERRPGRDRRPQAYPGPDGDVTVLDGVSIARAPASRLCVMGPSGSGKSTLLAILGALETPDVGRPSRWPARIHSALSERDLAAFRNRRVGFVFQDHCLLPQLTALENVLVPTLVARRPTRPHPRAGSRAAGGGGPGSRLAAPARPSCSGGEKQRVALGARAGDAAGAAAVRRADRQPRRPLGRDGQLAPAGAARGCARCWWW